MKSGKCGFWHESACIQVGVGDQSDWRGLPAISKVAMVKGVKLGLAT